MSSIQQIANTISLGKENKSKDKQKEPTTNGKKAQRTALQGDNLKPREVID